MGRRRNDDPENMHYENDAPNHIGSSNAVRTVETECFKPARVTINQKTNQCISYVILVTLIIICMGIAGLGYFLMSSMSQMVEKVSIESEAKFFEKFSTINQTMADVQTAVKNNSDILKNTKNTVSEIKNSAVKSSELEKLSDEVEQLDSLMKLEVAKIETSFISGFLAASDLGKELLEMSELKGVQLTSGRAWYISSNKFTYNNSLKICEAQRLDQFSLIVV